MSAHFAAAIPNLRIVELDVDRIENDHLIFTHEPEVRNGFMLVPNRPGWGTEPNESYIKTIPANQSVCSDEGLLRSGILIAAIIL